MAGVRQKPRQQDRRDQPRESRDLERGRRAAHRKIDRKRRERRKTAEQPWRHERAMVRARQRVVSRRRMQERIDTIAENTQNCHGTRASARFQKDAPERLLYRCHTCQSEIKRTLRARGSRSKTRCRRRFRMSATVHSMQMVNGGFPEPADMVSKWWKPRCGGFRHEMPSIENLHRIKSIGFFAVFPGFNFNTNTCDLSTAVSQKDWLRDQSQRKQKGRSGREMFFLLRMAFWLGLVLVLLPRDKTPELESCRRWARPKPYPRRRRRCRT